MTLPQFFFKRKELIKDPIPTLGKILKQYIRSVLYIAGTGIIPSVAYCHVMPLRGGALWDPTTPIICFSLGMLGFFIEPISR
jgi:hypothetical protein